MTTRWQSWHAAFEEAGKSNDSGGSQRLTLDLAPAEFAKALKALDGETEGMSRGDSRYQAACAMGHLNWFDEQGRCVALVRHGSVASEYEVDGKRRAPLEMVFPAGTLLTPEEATPRPGETPFQQFDRSAAPIIKAAEERAIAAEPSGIVAAVKSVLPKGKKK